MYGTHLGKLREIVQQGKVSIWAIQVCVLDMDLQGGSLMHSMGMDWHYLFI